MNSAFRKYHSGEGSFASRAPLNPNKCATCGLRELYKRADANAVNQRANDGLLHSRYKILSQISSGTFAVLVRAVDTFSASKKRHVAIKIMHSDKNCTAIGLQEVQRLRMINDAFHTNDKRVVVLLDSFFLDERLHIVLELLGRPVVEFTGRDLGQPRGRSLNETRKVAIQMLGVMAALMHHSIIHGDLKPENILYIQPVQENMQIKVVDFGNAMAVNETSQYYDNFDVQSLPYRAPEVVFGVPFSFPIDMWSLGCLLLEVATGERFFTASDASTLLTQMHSLLGPVPSHLFSKGKYYQLYRHAQPSCFTHESRPNVAFASLNKRIERSSESRHVRGHFVSFLLGFLDYDPQKRFSPLQALAHPFVAPAFPFELIMNTHNLGRARGSMLKPEQALGKSAAASSPVKPEKGLREIAAPVEPPAKRASGGVAPPAPIETPAHGTHTRYHSDIPADSSPHKRKLDEMKATDEPLIEIDENYDDDVLLL